MTKLNFGRQQARLHLGGSETKGAYQQKDRVEQSQSVKKQDNLANIWKKKKKGSLVKKKKKG